MAVVEQMLSRLQITRATMLEILGAAGEVTDSAASAGGPGGGNPGPAAVPGGGSTVGVMLVPPREAGADGGALPQDYRDILEIAGDAGRPFRAGHIAAALGIAQDRSTVESLRAKLKRLTARGLARRGERGPVHHRRRRLTQTGGWRALPSEVSFPGFSAVGKPLENR